jgi:hypothetical protein
VRIGPFATHEEANRDGAAVGAGGHVRIHSGSAEAMAARTASERSSRVA